MAAKNQAVVLKSFSAEAPTSGGSLEARDVADPAAGEVQVQLRLAGVNPSDVFSLMGVYPGFTSKLPAVPGFDGMGVVTKVGSGVSGIKEGQRVTAMGWQANEGQGTWQQYVNIKQEFVVPLPDDISDEAGAQFFINPVTVVGLLEVASVPSGGQDYLLVTAAGSTLSKMMIAVAKHQGVKVIGTVRRPEQVQEIKALGADAVVCTSTHNLAQEVMTITGGKGAYAAIDSIGGDGAADLAGAVRPGGTVYLYGLMGGLDLKGVGPALLFRDVRYHGFWLVTWLAAMTPAQRQQVQATTLDLMAKNIMKPDTGKVFPLSQWEEAVQYSQATARGGKVLLRCN